VDAGRYALLFPGQGAQFPGMAARFHDRSAAVRQLFDLAEQRTGLPIRTLCFETGRTDQSRTDWTQPSVFVASLAGWLVFRELLADRGRPYAPGCVAGHSLGHFAALVAAGALDVPTALDLVCHRGRIMSAASGRRPGGMLTVVGLPASAAAELAARCVPGPVALAAVNGSDQTVLSGAADGLAEAAELARRAGATRVVPLAIGLAAHSPLMADAHREFAAVVAAVPLGAPEVAVALNTTAAVTRDVAEIRADLLDHMIRPVRWAESVQAARRAGATRLIDMGPGRTLVKILLRDVPADEVSAFDQPGAAGALFG
jgi:[acyl-carrier-protein] S-malonyltransferase